MHEQPPSARQLIRAAIAAAGRGPVVAQSLGVSVTAVNFWAQKGRIPADRIKPLCDLASNVVTPTQILDALSREASEKAAA